MKISEKKEIQLQLNETPINFSMIVDDIVQEKSCTYIEAVLLYCNTNNIEPEHIICLISNSLKLKIEEEACNSNQIKFQYRPARLPL